MSSYAPLTIDGVEVATFRNGVDLSVAVLFGRGEFLSRPAVGDEVERWEQETAEDDNVVIHELVTTALALRDRLDVLGIGMHVVDATFARLITEKLEIRQAISQRISSLGSNESHEAETQLLGDLTIENWIARVRSLHDLRDFRGSARDCGSLSWLFGLWEESDNRVLLRAVVEAFPLASEVRIDVTDFVLDGYMTPEENPHEAALTWFRDEISSGSPVILLTEGVSDARILQAVIEVTKPHLKEFFRLPDFSLSPESSASSLVKTVKTFASAGIGNRVVAVFDNDTAAEDSLRVLPMAQLPKNISVLRLPPLPVADSYPTIGPAGISEMNVNGLAGSIELYLGEDVLTGPDGKLYPVQWTGFNEGLGRYQGVLTQKRQIQRAFEAKVARALTEAVPPKTHDWTGIDLILDSIIHLLSE